MISKHAALERNLQLFPRYKAATSILPWLPVFFLYFIERVPLGEAVLLGSAYYFSVFLLEVPSGYCSDRFGRRPTLILASIMTVIACVLFAVANSFGVLLAAQVLLAAGVAFQSGSDSALLYDSLHALGREQEYTERETIAQKWSMTALACSCLVGGALGVVDLRLAYAVALLAALVAVTQCLRFTEPPIEDDSRAIGFVTQVKHTLGYFSHPLLGWMLGFFIIGYSLEHVPYEFYQPYLKLLGQSELTGWLAVSSAPLVSGLVISISMFGGAIGAAISQRLINRVGLRALLLASVCIQVVIIAGLSLALHPIMLVLVMFRNFSMSMAHGPMLGAIAPHVPSAQRATFLSLLSLSGRAAFSIALAMLSILVVGKEALNWPALSQVLGVSAVFGIVALSLLYFWSRRLASVFSRSVQRGAST
jgi:MFS family permease